MLALFGQFPYLLPTVFAGLILFIGAILACFLSWDGGVRGGERIALPVEKNEPLEPAPQPSQDEDRSASPVPSHRTAVPSLRGKRSMVLSPGIEESGPIGFGTSVPHARRDSRASLGTAYGFVFARYSVRSRLLISDMVVFVPNTPHSPRGLRSKLLGEHRPGRTVEISMMKWKGSLPSILPRSSCLVCRTCLFP